MLADLSKFRDRESSEPQRLGPEPALPEAPSQGEASTKEREWSSLVSAAEGLLPEEALLYQA